MIQNSLRALAIVAACVALVACSSGSAPSSAPTNISVEAGDSQVTVTWTQESDLQYWLFLAAAPSITRENFSQFPQSRIITPVTSPYVVGGLTNDTTYSFLLNATKDSGPAGPSTASVSAVPRLAGATWTNRAALGTGTLNDIVVGIGKFVIVGNGGAIYSSTDGITFTPSTSGTPADLNGIAFDPTNGRYVAIGANGTLLTSTDAAAWTAGTSGSTVQLNGIVHANGVFVAVGAGGTVLTSSDATTWTARTSGTTNDLFDVKFLNSGFFALGAGGTLLASTDGVTWTARNLGITADLRGATFRSGTYLIVGTGGAILTSTDATTWSAQPGVTTRNLYSANGGSQFVIVGEGGTVLTSTTGTSWSTATSNTTSDLFSVVFGGGRYIAVGTAGTNISAN